MTEALFVVGQVCRWGLGAKTKNMNQIIVEKLISKYYFSYKEKKRDENHYIRVET